MSTTVWWCVMCGEGDGPVWGPPPPAEHVCPPRTKKLRGLRAFITGNTDEATGTLSVEDLDRIRHEVYGNPRSRPS